MLTKKNLWSIIFSIPLFLSLVFPRISRLCECWCALCPSFGVYSYYLSLLVSSWKVLLRAVSLFALKW